MVDIPFNQARRFILDVQGLRTLQPCSTVIDVAKRVHNIQIDTMSVVSRSHNLVIFNRLPDYEEGAVWETLQAKSFFEYWSHAMCFLPMESFSYYALRMQQFKAGRAQYWTRWGARNADLVEEVYSSVRKNGPTSSSSFKSKGSRGWGGGPESRALQYLHMTGRLLVAYRENFQKFYDLSERVLPEGTDAEPMSETAADEFTVLTTISSLGLASSQDIQLYMGRFRARKKWGANNITVDEYVEEFVNDDRVNEVSIESARDRYFVLSRNLDKLQKASMVRENQEPIKFLSPFDNLIRERHYPLKLWNFEYKLESYMPPAERKYGYHVLPLLDGVDLVGRMDAKLHRRRGVLEIVALYLESGFWREEDGLARLGDGLHEFAAFQGASEIELKKVTPRKGRKVIAECLSS